MNLTVSIAQMKVAVSRPEENLEKTEGLIAEAARRGSDLVCFPEMWTTGFNWRYLREAAEEHGKIVGRVGTLARRYGIWVNGSLPTLADRGRIANTSILFNPSGEQAGVYRKTHLFSLLHEDEHLVPGDSLTMVDTPWGPVGLSICYDIRFPELFRTYALQGARMVLSPVAFPHPRLDHWRVLVRARAIENQMYLVGVNRVGNEDFGQDGAVTFFGHSGIIDPWGRTVVEGDDTEETLLTATIDLGEADAVRSRMRVLSDRRPDLYRLG